MCYTLQHPFTVLNDLFRLSVCVFPLIVFLVHGVFAHLYTWYSMWAPYWYDAVHSSSGFNTGIASTHSKAAAAARERVSGGGGSNCTGTSTGTSLCGALTCQQRELYREVLPFYDLLRARAIGVDVLCPDTSVHVPVPGPVSTDSTKEDGGGGGEGNSSRKRSIDRLSDTRNADVLVWVGDRLRPRECAKVSVFDSAVQGGDAVWEGLRVYENSIFRLDEHLDRLMDSAKAMAFENIPSRSFILHAITSTLRANGMTQGGAHMRLTLTRGAKLTSSMNPLFNVFGCNLLVVPEWKPVGDMATYDNKKGIKLITATNRRNSPQCVDSKIHHNNLINNSTFLLLFS
jgi:hypothetical protein